MVTDIDKLNDLTTRFLKETDEYPITHWQTFSGSISRAISFKDVYKELRQTDFTHTKNLADWVTQSDFRLLSKEEIQAYDIYLDGHLFKAHSRNYLSGNMITLLAIILAVLSVLATQQPALAGSFPVVAILIVAFGAFWGGTERAKIEVYVSKLSLLKRLIRELPDYQK